MEVVSWCGFCLFVFLCSLSRAGERAWFFSFSSTHFALSPPLSLSLSLSLSLKSLSLPLNHSYAKVVPTTLDASVVGGRASREADARIKAAEGSASPASPSPSDAPFPLHAVHTYQYSITEKFSPLDAKSPAIPSVSISYDMSPLTLSLSRPKTPILHAAVRLVAVAGGVKALASFFGALLHALAGRRRGDGSGRRSSGSGGGE